MQDRYVGDVGDFGKYGLLRYLAGRFDSSSPLRLGVIWYRVASESHNNDGAKIQYLRPDKAADFQLCDPELYLVLRDVVTSSTRTLREIQSRAILPTTTTFFDDELGFSDIRDRGTRARRRSAWVARALRATENADIVFADPDNGLQCKSVGPFDRLGPKYAFYDELLPVIDRKQTLVVYHHTCRHGSAHQQIWDRLGVLASFRREVELFALRFKRGNSRAFLIAAAPAQSEAVRARAANLLRSAWHRHFELVEHRQRRDGS
jgi:hypothetical protein